MASDARPSLDTTTFQNKIGEHRHPQLHRPGPGTAGCPGAGSHWSVHPSLWLPGEHRPHGV